MVVLADDLGGPKYPSAHNILAAMDWLVSEPGYSCFLHYSGHGGIVRDFMAIVRQAPMIPLFP
jgi:hypothetical protein